MLQFYLYRKEFEQNTPDMAVSTDSAHKGIQERFTAAVNVIRGLPKNGKHTCQQTTAKLLHLNRNRALVQSNHMCRPHRPTNKLNGKKQNKQNSSYRFCAAVDVRI